MCVGVSRCESKILKETKQNIEEEAETFDLLVWGLWSWDCKRSRLEIDSDICREPKVDLGIMLHMCLAW